MSWNPLKKLQRHGSKSHLIQKDLLEKHASKLEQLENTTKKLYKDAKKYEDCILEVNRCEKKMTSDLSNSLLCHEEQRVRELIEEWHSYVSQANVFDEDLVLVTQRTVVGPLKKFQSVFSETNSAIKKRDKSIQECNKATHRVNKLQEKEKTGPNIVKLQSAKQNLANLEDDCKSQNQLLKSELPLLYEGRIKYFQPCLEALIKAQTSLQRLTQWKPILKNLFMRYPPMRESIPKLEPAYEPFEALNTVGTVLIYSRIPFPV